MIQVDEALNLNNGIFFLRDSLILLVDAYHSNLGKFIFLHIRLIPHNFLFF